MSLIHPAVAVSKHSEELSDLQGALRNLDPSNPGVLPPAQPMEYLSNSTYWVLAIRVGRAGQKTPASQSKVI